MPTYRKWKRRNVYWDKCSIHQTSAGVTGQLKKKWDEEMAQTEEKSLIGVDK